MKRIGREVTVVFLVICMFVSMFSGVVFATPENPGVNEVVYNETFENIPGTPIPSPGLKVPGFTEVSNANNTGWYGAAPKYDTSSNGGSWAMKTANDNVYKNLTGIIVPGKEYKLQFDVKTVNPINFYYAVHKTNPRAYRCDWKPLSVDANYNATVGPVSYADLPASAKFKVYNTTGITVQVAMPTWISYKGSAAIAPENQTMEMRYGDYYDTISYTRFTNTYNTVTVEKTIKIPKLDGIDPAKIAANKYELYLNFSGRGTSFASEYYIDNMVITCLGDNNVSAPTEPLTSHQVYKNLIAYDDATTSNQAVYNPTSTQYSPSTTTDWGNFDETRNIFNNTSGTNWWLKSGRNVWASEGNDGNRLLPKTEGAALGKDDNVGITSVQSNQYCVPSTQNYGSRWFFNSSPFNYQNNGTLLSTPEYISSFGLARNQRALNTTGGSASTQGNSPVNGFDLANNTTKILSSPGGNNTVFAKNNKELYFSALCSCLLYTSDAADE